ncbi:dienelactone hydrolase family protein [Vallitalea okinawensis]|uniref:dienelactone hydrolase family protein n=1 Tax=Vallitalea okinawensis TaxID=2078660 RepID=UPI000CFD1462|nr:dienelactone hydrolase family protein [Vallitalea okinawensis]
MEWAIFEYENNFTTTTREVINSVPCLKVRAKNSSGILPTIIYYHGWHSSKEFEKFQAMSMVSFGYQVIIPDALYHGERDPIDHDNPKNLEKYVWDIIFQSINESEKFISEIIEIHGADPTRIGVIGSSMGAITASGVLVKNKIVKCLIGLNGTFAWQEAIKRNHLPMSSVHQKSIEYFDPMNNMNQLIDRAISILHGIDDTSLSIETQRLFYNRILPQYYMSPEKIQLIEYSKIDHRITIGMLEAAITWFIKHL